MYSADSKRYDAMKYKHAGASGLKLPRISLGFWHNFGHELPYDKVKEMVFYAFDHGITHFDLANNYGLPHGSAEENLGRLMKEELSSYRDQIAISTKAGYYMWEGPYGNGGSRKYMLSSLDQSLERMGLRYVDIFYSHRYDPETPLEETMGALSDAVKMGKAIYVGLSNYPRQPLEKAIGLLKRNGTPPVLFQPHFSLMDRTPLDDGSIDLCEKEGVGVIPYSIFNQGILTGKYLDKIPTDSRMANPDNPFLNKSDWTKPIEQKIREFANLAKKSGYTMTNLALAGLLHEKGITSALVGVSRLSQLEELIGYCENPEISDDLQEKIRNIFI